MIPRPAEADDKKVQELMDKIVLLDKKQVAGLLWRIEEYFRENKFADRWREMIKQSPLIAEIHAAIAPAVRKLGDTLTRRLNRKKIR